MKRIITAATLFCAALALLAGCNDTVERTLYEGPEYIMFADTLNDRYVTPEGNITVDVAATRVFDYDRTFGIEVVAKGSTAIENRHFNLVSDNVTIKAGELAAKVELKAYYTNFEATDSLGTILRLVTPENTQWGLYTIQTKVVFQKYYPFNAETWFENEKRASNPAKYDYANYILYATFPYSNSVDQLTKMLIKVKADPKDNHRMIIQEPFQTDLPLRIIFEEVGPGEDYIKVLPQETLYTSDYGMVTMASTAQQVSVFNTGLRSAALYLNCYVESYGSFGVFPYYLQWISEHDAEEIRNNGF